MKLLVLGVGGMLGSALANKLSESHNLTVYGSLRRNRALIEPFINPNVHLTDNVDVTDFSSLADIIISINPDMVLNCVGVVKQLKEASDPCLSILINSLLPHRLYKICRQKDIRLIHFSTDCVFSGTMGNYTESMLPDCSDLYGRSKLLGEISSPGCITLRTSIIGHELLTRHSLVDWFLSQVGTTPIGYSKAIYSGFPTTTIADIIRDVIIPNESAYGLYNLASQPISKFALLEAINSVYKLGIQIRKDEEYIIDRSLDASRFNTQFSWTPPAWLHMLKSLETYYRQYIRVHR